MSPTRLRADYTHDRRWRVVGEVGHEFRYYGTYRRPEQALRRQRQVEASSRTKGEKR